MRTHRILGIDFFGGTSREAVDEITRRGGLLVAPAAPSMVNLCRDEDYRRAILGADLAIADSGFMVLLWKLFTGERVPRISGLEHVKRLLEHESIRDPSAVIWVVATERSKARLEEFLSGERVRLARSGRRPAGQPGGLETPAVAAHPSGQPSDHVYVAPKYGRPIEDVALLALVRQIRPIHIVIAIGGGIQDKLGHYLLEHLDYRPAVHCIGAALGFLTGDQVRIPDWADKYYLGWFFRSVAQPRVFIPRFWSARRLPRLIFQWRDRLPPMEKG
ncbi:MAG TPA: WecB/TagA/CpsF family glycosyltransferase [Chthoniobacterales bacterium]|jgi:UDP-N-acetyl-D-mannosaminuronic acid transferase (WecB/TagA/CpsF family)